MAESEITYPYADGDTSVLGPEVFASSDGSIISWRGTNYVKQEELDQLDQEANELLNNAADRIETLSAENSFLAQVLVAIASYRGFNPTSVVGMAQMAVHDWLPKVKPSEEKAE